LTLRIVTADIGGTHARFALADVDGGAVALAAQPVTFQTQEHVGFESAWQEYGRRLGEPLPRDLAISFAGPVGEPVLRLTNSSWTIRPAEIAAGLELRRLTVVNDFGAVAHAVAAMGDSGFAHLSGPDRALPREGLITVLGPGTGLGVAALLRNGNGYQVIETEGGHLDFAPLDEVEDRMLAVLRAQFGRVSVERLLSGRGLLNIHQALAAMADEEPAFHDERALWSAALDGSDDRALAALERFCLTLGSVAGDLALAQGASAAAIGGGLGLRLAQHLPRSGFADRFVTKGRFAQRMAELPVKLITHPQPGLLGAAAAWVREHGRA
jgi:glucokinase